MPVRTALSRRVEIAKRFAQGKSFSIEPWEDFRISKERPDHFFIVAGLHFWCVRVMGRSGKSLESARGVWGSSGV